ncbi:MAG: hypothetical protein ABI878_07780 [Acidobacteriota bacterium]
MKFRPVKSGVQCPVEEKRRQWIDSCFVWLLRAFRDTALREKPILTPTPEHFPVNFAVLEETAFNVLDIVAPQMDLDPDDIEIDPYQEAATELKSGSALNARIFLKQVDHERYSAGHYRGKEEDGKFHIGVEVKTLKVPEKLIAVIAHELAHLKLLGEGRLKENNEPLTDLCTVIFGLGIFGANSAFRMYNGSYSWGYNRTGYLSQMDWGYALALWADIRREKEPEWVKYLTQNIRHDFKRSTQFIQDNSELIMKSPPKESDEKTEESKA